jgi:hypothetical protein
MPSRREKEKKAVKEEAEKILNKFAEQLSKVREVPERFLERESDRRQEQENNVNKKIEQENKEFRKAFFENAPQTKKDCILAEKGGWK